jgi:hypothetical protein
MPKGIYERKSTEERFWSNVDIKDKNECWDWKGAFFTCGYGAFGINYKTLYAHRVAWTLTHGEITDGVIIRHTCDHRPCCNPYHLKDGTQKDNMQDMKNKGRGVGIKGSANKNHKLTEKDVIEIRDKIRLGYTHKCLATEYGVNASIITDIGNRKRWKHI